MKFACIKLCVNNYFIGRNFKNAVALFVARKKSLFCPFFWSETSGND